MTSAPTDPMTGRLIDGRYEVRSRIARGGMATVYVANDLRLDRRVAIKIMHGHLADDEAFRERFVQEARSAARLAHPNVVSVFDQGSDSDMAYMVMEYLPGMTLRDLLKDYGRLTTEQTLDIMEAVLGGLAAAHKAGIVHRDVKPENVLLADDGRIKIGDFGLARAASANTATGQALLGTIAYLSPELLTRGVADARSDIYASGIMMYEMLVGEQPYLGEQPMQIAFQHANETVPAPSVKNPSVPPEVDEIVVWATSRDPEARPHDAREMLDALRDAEESTTASIRATAALLRTAVMPPMMTGAISEAETQVLGRQNRPSAGHPSTAYPLATGVTAATAATVAFGSQAAAPSAAAGGLGSPAAPAPALLAAAGATALAGTKSHANPVEKLATKNTKRRRRGWWIFALVVVLVASAGGTGWFFSAGPGGQLRIPSVSDKSPDDATAALVALGLTVTPGTATNPTVPTGAVIGTDPPAGASVLNGTQVTLVTSIGPAQLPVPALVGQNADAAKQAATAAGFTVVDPQQTQFSSSVAAGTVIQASGADGQPLGATYGEQQPITLLVSLGGIPDVVGKSAGDANAALVAVGLVSAAGSEEYSDTVAKGDVISVDLPADPVHLGATVTLNTSRGPEPVTVPDVTGKSWSDAKAALQKLGFSLAYNGLADLAPDAFTVRATDPAAGASLDKGSKITVSFSGF
ncbi:Stk1 family PASTA domain-containing Ser/Thr kinase [Subtercola frigoramans]|uniref:non-specific serine/threonine protein kinase n=1 Tax=Subtercola frigoramans TaxID=120298 RepID=A0ABS2L5S8_9MICO|nr:Stk1 family PASTA domain-containing Ser/Thr kinase [Subtercola frigoramans]MBM7472398.1 serine/threonine-protein kinase [Subtercola frigoramans]